MVFPRGGSFEYLSAARIDCNILSAHKEMFGLNTEDRIATTPWGKHLHLDEIENVVKKDFVLYKHKIKQMVNALDLSAEEEAILAGVILTFTGISLLLCVINISRKNSCYLKMLHPVGYPWVNL